MGETGNLVDPKKPLSEQERKPDDYRYDDTRKDTIPQNRPARRDSGNRIGKAQQESLEDTSGDISSSGSPIFSLVNVFY